MSLNKKIILMNGPARSGKDTAATILHKHLNKNSFEYKMSFPLKEACHKMLGLHGTLLELEPLKEVPIKFLIQESYDHFPAPITLVNEHREMTLRQFYIHISENLMKPMFGDDIFGRLAVENIKQNNQEIVSISDSGFANEALPIIEHYGAQNVCLIRIYRPGYGFDGDSRKYIDLHLPFVSEVQNDSTLEVFAERIITTLETGFLIDGKKK